MPDPIAILTLWHRRIIFRRALRHMLQATPHLILDIGLTEAEARVEATRPFWRS